MISKWGVTNFKSIREVNLDLAPLTIFTGVNSSGKSSFLDSILLSSQFYDENKEEEDESKKNETRFKLNSDNIKLGEAKHIFHNNSKQESIDCNFIIDEQFRKYRIEYSLMLYKPYSRNKEINTMRAEKIKGFSIEKNFDLEVEQEFEFDREQAKEFLFNFFSPRNFSYLGPFRPSPQFSYIKQSDIKNKYVNSDGSNTFAVLKYWLHDKDDKNIIKCIPDNIEKMNYNSREMDLFSTILNSWLKYFDLSDSCDVIPEPESKSDIRNLRPKSNTYNDKPENEKFILSMNRKGKPYTLPQLGSGVSQILPILTMCLIAPKNSTIIIKEPEAHFHPKVQSKLADFFIAIALTGRQCLIETHSEYFIEQLRYHIVKHSDYKPEPLHKLTKLYFVTNKDEPSQFKNIEVDGNAMLDEWPEDFFDETHITIWKIMKEIAKKEEKDRKNE